MQDQGQYQVHSVGVVGAHSHCILSSAKETTRDMRERRRESISFSSLPGVLISHGVMRVLLLNNLCLPGIYKKKFFGA